MCHFSWVSKKLKVFFYIEETERAGLVKFAQEICDATSKGQDDLSVSGFKLRSEKNHDDDEGRSAEGGTANEIPTDLF